MKNLLFSILCFLVVSDAFAQQLSGYIFRVGINASSTKVNNFTYTDKLIFDVNGVESRSLENFADAQASTFAIPVGVEVFGIHLN